ncbi:four-helix bundle copper-binding protein [Arthrobacter sp. zg-Y826]|uniref:four-helix bundle copper-binding protein n=1 Tax=Arthrobacter jinronghuae TaxID=2964609 RepID=UPI0021068F3C|nr:four-helix bundle copper-binding protein [Arthrobacter jinronghuae]MCQ1955701.1 four-helix bundle copper-binding protein [Arthrobacter jinronghuae]
MALITEMLENHPAAGPRASDPRLLVECLLACGECAQVCNACADACLSEEMVGELVSCIRTDLDCAEICATTSAVLSRTGTAGPASASLLHACIAACAACAEECQQHAAMHQHCRICAEACRRCINACEKLLTSLG